MEKGHSALRHGRYSQPGQVYLITATTKDREPLFLDWQMARAVCTAMHAFSSGNEFRLLSWVVMPDHVHCLLQLGERRDLSSVVRFMKSRSAMVVNKAGRRTGAVWDRGFHDRAIRREEDILPAARYIVMNPVRAGICRKVGDYPFWDAVWI